MQENIASNTVEPNSSLGKAFNYWLKRWDSMTRYLTVAGAPLDNSCIEQVLKKAILFRKNCLFHKTESSARVSSHLMSVINTALEAGANPIEYLVALIENEELVLKEPELWMPWNYTAQLTDEAKAA